MHGRRVAVLVDTSDASFGFGRRTQFIQDLTVNFSIYCYFLIHIMCENVENVFRLFVTVSLLLTRCGFDSILCLILYLKILHKADRRTGLTSELLVVVENEMYIFAVL